MAKDNQPFRIIKNDSPIEEKRLFPRFPYNFLTFSPGDKVYEIIDITKDCIVFNVVLDGEENQNLFKVNDKISGKIHWHGLEIILSGIVESIIDSRVEISFIHSQKSLISLDEFLNIENLMKGLRPLHNSSFDIEHPPTLKYWLHGDGPLDLFFWVYENNEYSSFQMILLHDFIEWIDGKGLRTGQAQRKRIIETPLISEDEYRVLIDPVLNNQRIEKGLIFLDLIKEHPKYPLIPLPAMEFLRRNLD